MNTHYWSTRLIIAFCLVQLFSCQKHIKNQNDSLEFEMSSDAAVVSEFTDCKLRTIEHKHSGIAGRSVKGTFVYHPDGLPQQLTYDVSGSGNPNFYFFYDSKRRLRELREASDPNSQAEPQWHKYGYNNLDQIIVDTSYNQHVEGDTTISQITYDNQNRVISETKRNIRGGTPWTITYEYDTRGNLFVEYYSSTYDNQKSIFRSHPLFQFIHRNYSKNNSAPQAKYNFKGLPLSNSPMNDKFFNADPGMVAGSGVTRATYDCDGFNPPNEFLNCKLRTIIHQDGYNYRDNNNPVKGTFVYFPDGMPDNLTYDKVGTGNPNYYFLYDNKRRLKEFRIGYSRNQPSDGGLWHRYGYNSFDQIIGDTVYNFTSTNPVVLGTPRIISTLSYDGQGRVIYEQETLYDGTEVVYTREYEYKYDGRGNLIVPQWTSSSYDNKVSIFRSHSVFQFIHRNYSKNNAVPQARYNSKGLPFSNNPINDKFFNAEPNNVGGKGITKANYDCP